MTVDGELLWELPETVDRLDSWPSRHLGVYSREHTDKGRLIYLMREGARNPSRRSDGLEGEWVINDEMLIVAGATGAVRASAKLPDLDEALRFADFSRTSANLTGSGCDIILREWRRDAGARGGSDRSWPRPWDRSSSFRVRARRDSVSAHASKRGAAISSGTWTVALHNSDCSKTARHHAYARGRRQRATSRTAPRKSGRYCSFMRRQRTASVSRRYTMATRPSRGASRSTTRMSAA